MRRVVLATLAVLVLAGVALGAGRWLMPAAENSAAQGEVQIGGPFALTDQNGREVKDEEFRGRVGTPGAAARRLGARGAVPPGALRRGAAAGCLLPGRAERPRRDPGRRAHGEPGRGQRGRAPGRASGPGAERSLGGAPGDAQRGACSGGGPCADPGRRPARTDVTIPVCASDRRDCPNRPHQAGDAGSRPIRHGRLWGRPILGAETDARLTAPHPW